MPITSQHNQRLKEIRKLRTRRRERERVGRFLAEGEDLLAAADARGWEPVERYCAAGSGLPGVEVEGDLLARASGLASGTRALAVYEERWAPAPVGPVCVYLHGVHDPGNVGAVLRSAEAFGAASVALGPGCADPFGPKAVRASMGAVFGVPVVAVDGVDGLPGVKLALVAGAGVPLAEALAEALAVVGEQRAGELSRVVAEGSPEVATEPPPGSLDGELSRVVAEGSPQIATEPPPGSLGGELSRVVAEGSPQIATEPPSGSLGGELPRVLAEGSPEVATEPPAEHLSNAAAPSNGTLTPAAAPPAVTLLVGAEREGLPAHIVAAADRVAHIPIHTESLNAAMAATVALYELTRQSLGWPAR